MAAATGLLLLAGNNVKVDASDIIPHAHCPVTVEEIEDIDCKHRIPIPL